MLVLSFFKFPAQPATAAVLRTSALPSAAAEREREREKKRERERYQLRQHAAEGRGERGADAAVRGKL